MFNFFRKQKSIKQDDIVASISYVVRRSSAGALIDVQLNDYDEESIDSLCHLLTVLGSDMFFIDTINIIKSSLIQENQEEVLIKIFSRLNSVIRDKILLQNQQKLELKDEPCIKPSDMLI